MQRSILPFLALGAFLTSALAQDPRFEFPGVSTPVRDAAKLFSAEAVRKAAAEIDRVERETKASVLVETVETAGDQPVKALAAANARRWGRHGIYVLIDKKDHKFEVLPTPGFEKAVIAEDVQTFRDAFLTQFRRGNFDDGLLNGVHAIGLTLTVYAKEGKFDHLASEDKFSKLARGARGASDLVARDQVRLRLPGARAVVEGAVAKAAEMNIKVNIAVVDDGGHLLSFERMDGARPASAYTAITKASAAATFRAETGPIPKGTTPPDLLLNLSLQNAAAASGGKLTALPGGIPIIVDGQVIGAVGVGGGSGEQDSEVARAGINRFLMQLKPAQSDQ
jgi:glc operon protein GlcG